MVIDNQLTTSSAADAAYAVSRPLGSDTVLLTGAVPQSAAPRRIRLAMDDPARHAAERLRRHLKARGIAVLGEVRVRRTPRPATTATLPAQPIAILPAAPLYEAIETVSKGSSNLQAELLLRHLGRLPAPTASTIAAPNPGASTIAGPGIDIPTGTTLDGLARLEHLLTSAGIYPEDYDLADGSGMSIYNRLSPASIVRLLVWIDRQPWGDDWTAAQAIGGVDGTLARRFTGTPLEGKVFAKSGTLFGTNTLSGFVQTARGNQLAFSIMVNDRDRESRTATPAIDAALLAIAERY
ncbi:MAG: D-alanyl-D-alanine carboxypeptidase [Pseudomonadota bacterium]